jgi:tetratricopeptide (TPR) repeat protein
MSNAAKLKKKAVELEQKKQFDKALALYIQFLQESDTAIDDIDVPLYNRVGDLLLRTGNASDALNYYEKAVDLYADRGFLNNAIALCNKVLRQSPGRASIYYKLGKISATKGFKSDAKKNFLEYADRMQKVGQIDEAFRALKEFADLCPDQDDIRLMLAEQLTKENRQNEALEQLQKLHDKLDNEGRMAEARATVDRMKAIDPEAVPRTSGSYRPQKSHDLIFLDTSFGQPGGRTRKAEPTPRPLSPPVGRQVSDPDLVVLTLGDTPDAPVSPVHNVAVADAFSLDVDTPAEPALAPIEMLDVDTVIDATAETPIDLADVVDVADVADVAIDLDVLTESEAPRAHTDDAHAVGAIDLDAVDEDAFALPAVAELGLAETPTVQAPDITVEHDPAPVDLVLDQPSYVSGPPLGIDYASDLAADVTLAPDDGADLFDFRLPPRGDDALDDAPTPLSLDPDVGFPAFDLDDTSLPSADEITSGASLAAALASPDPLAETGADSFDASLGSGLGGLDMLTGADSLADGLDLDAPDAPAADGSAASLDLDWSAPAPVAASDGTALELDALDVMDVMDVDAPAPEPPAALDDIPDAIDDVMPVEALAANDPHAEIADAVVEIPIEQLIDASPVDHAVSDDATPNVIAALDAEPLETLDAVIATPVAREPEAAPSWEVQRTYAERLLEAGDRAGGVRELEDIAAELERTGDLERALSIVDELIRLLPDSARHHQKRVELSFRSNDRVRLIDAYLELGDALFRSGEERKARAVYQRVYELAPDDPRAKAAVESVAALSLPTASGSIPAIPAPSAPSPSARQAGPPPRAPETHVSYQPNGSGGRPSPVAPTPPPSRKPVPLDPAVASSDFVDLGEWLRSGDSPKSTRMVTEEKPPTGDEQADFQEMLKRFKQGVAENVEEEDYESHYDLGVAYKEMGLIDEAVAEFQKALRGTAYRVRTYEALGQCFVEKEQYQVAASVLTRALSLGEGDDHQLVGVLYLLARSTEALNKHTAALDYYQRVFAVDIEFRDVADRISAIERKAT